MSPIGFNVKGQRGGVKLKAADYGIAMRAEDESWDDKSRHDSADGNV